MTMAEFADKPIHPIPDDTVYVEARAEGLGAWSRRWEARRFAPDESLVALRWARKIANEQHGSLRVTAIRRNGEPVIIYG